MPHFGQSIIIGDIDSGLDSISAAVTNASSGPRFTDEEIEKLKDLVRLAYPIAAPALDDGVIEPLPPASQPPKIEAKDVTPERTVQALLKHPKLAYKVALLLNAAKIAGPWRSTDNPDLWIRANPAGMTTVGVMRMEEERLGYGMIVLEDYAADPTTKATLYTTKEEAQKKADEELAGRGYALVDEVSNPAVPA